MASIVVNGDTSGAVTLSAPAVAGTVTVTLPSANGTMLTTATAGVPVNGPAFSAYQSSAQTISASTYTKVNLQTEEFDTNACFDNATNYRFTPTVAGYYQVSGSIRVGASRTQIQVFIYKNGSSIKDLGTDVSSNVAQCNGSALVYFNGSTDYIELYCWIGATQALAAGVSGTYFQAAMIRSAV